MNKKSEKKTDSDLDKQVSGIIDKITEGVEAKLSKKFSTKKPSKKIAGLMGKGSVKAKDVSKMSKEEKIYGFMQAVVQGNDEKSKMFYDDAREKALQEGVAAVGGNLVPNEFRAEIIREVREQYQMRNLVTVKKMKRLTMDIPKAVNRVKVYWTKEAAVKTTTTATFTQKQLIAYKLAAILYITDELRDDAYDFDIVRDMINDFAENIGDKEEEAITNGSGTNEPTGLTNCTIATVTCAGNLDFDDMINLEYAVPSRYRRAGRNVFIAHSHNIREMRKIRSDSGAGAGTGTYLWADPVAVGQPGTFHGYPVIENNYLPEASIFFGDFKKAYWLGDRQQMTVKVSSENQTAWERDEVGIRVVSRIGGTCVLENAIRELISIP